MGCCSFLRFSSLSPLGFKLAVPFPSLLADQGCTEEERSALWEHVSGFDLPEDVPTYRRLAAAAGFSRVECLHVSRTDLFRFVLFAKE